MSFGHFECAAYSFYSTLKNRDGYIILENKIRNRSVRQKTGSHCSGANFLNDRTDRVWSMIKLIREILSVDFIIDVWNPNSEAITLP